MARTTTSPSSGRDAALQGGRAHAHGFEAQIRVGLILSARCPGV
jgi:hypothetical protein